MGLLDLINDAKDFVQGATCGQKCQCKRSCEAELYWNDDLVKACKDACKGPNPPASGMAFYNSLPADIRYQMEDEFIDPDIEYVLGTSSYQPIYIALGLVIAVLLYFYFKS